MPGNGQLDVHKAFLHRADVDSSRQEKTIVLRVRPHDAPSVWREIELLERHTLHDLHGVLQVAFELDDDHLYTFYLNNKPFDRVYDYECPRASGAKRQAHRTPLSSLPLKVNKRFLYLFDFGDELRHEVQVLRYGEATPGASYPRIVGQEGEAPKHDAFWDDPEAHADEDMAAEAPEDSTAPTDDATTSHCHHDSESAIPTPMREQLERMLPDVVRSVVAHRLHRSNDDDAFDEDVFDVDEDSDQDRFEDEDQDSERADSPELTREELIRDYDLAKELLRCAESKLDVIHIVLEHATNENVVGWLFELPEALSNAGLHDAAIDLANVLHAAEPEVGMNHLLVALLLEAGLVEAADAALIEPLAGDPDNPELLHLKAEVEQAKGNIEAAIEHYRAALEWSGSNSTQRYEILEPLCELLEANGNRAAAAQLRQREVELTNSLTKRLHVGGGTVRRDQPKVGRNDPCPCGSGKKYKKCCGKAS